MRSEHSSCHAERSEGSAARAEHLFRARILRCAQNDNQVGVTSHTARQDAPRGEAHYTGRSSTIPCHPQSATHYSPLTIHYSFLAYTPLVVEIRLIGVRGVGEVRPGDEPAALLVEAFERQGERFQSGDVLVVTQKIVSKAEGRLVDLRTVEPSPFARAIAPRLGKGPRHVEVILRESARVVRMDRGVLIAETHHGLVCANAGVDAS